MTTHLRLASLALAMCVMPAAAISAAEIEVQSNIDTVTVYPDGATVTRIIQADLPQGDTTLLARDFPQTLDPSSLRVEGAGDARLLIGSIDARAPRPAAPAATPAVAKRLEELRDERAALTDKLSGLATRRKFIERFATDVPLGVGEKANARPVADWREAWGAVSEEIAAVDALIRDAKLKQREIDREIATLETEIKVNPPRKLEVRIELSAAGAGQGTLRVSYTVRGARWLPLYDARLDTGAKDRKAALELVRRAEIVQQTGEDWNEVALSVSTVRTAKGGKAPELPPLLVRYPRPPVIQDRIGRLDPLMSRQEPAAAPPAYYAEDRKREVAQEREAIVETGGFQAVFRIPGRISVPATEAAKNFRIATMTLAPDLLVRTTPALDQTAYLEASFKQAEEAPLLPGRVALYRDDIYVGRGQMTLTPKDETVRLGFGADEKIKVARAPMRKTEGSTGFISTSKTDEREYKMTVRNGHDTPIQVVVEDQVPVSENSEVQVELLPVTTAPSQSDVMDRRGVLAWNFELAPGAAREIRLGWRVRWPANREIAFEPRQP